MQITTTKVCRHPMHGTQPTSIRFERENGWQIRQGENCKGNWIENLTECIDEWNQKCQRILDEMPIEECKPLEFPVSHLEGWITALGFCREAFVSANSPPTPDNHLAFDFGRDVSETWLRQLCEAIKNRDSLAAFDALRYLLVR